MEGRKENECGEAAKFGRCEANEKDIYKARQWGKCAKSRENVNNKCFDGGDMGHRQAANQAREAELKCMGLQLK